MKTLKSNKATGPVTHGIGRLGLLPVVAVGLIVFMAAPDATAAKQFFNDSTITSAVKSDLRSEEGVLLNSVDVSTSRGIVTLSGSVDNILAKRLAVNIAESVRGVLGVSDQISLTPETRPDEDIRKDILMALLNDPATEPYKISATVNGAVTTLTGVVGSQAERQLAQRVAEGVSGIKGVRNNLTINYAQKRTDAEVSADIQAVLDWDVWTTGYPIRVAVKDGQVTLSGEVGSVVERSRVYSDAWVNGVLSVDDAGVKINPLARENLKRRITKAARSDIEIKKAVEASLRMDPRVSPYTSMINITVEKGAVILDGVVENRKADDAAGRDARDIVGVSRVDDVLSVRPALNLPGDADTQKGLQAALHWDPLLTGVQIEAAVFNHIAYLNGWVDSPRQRAEAQDVASRTKGVLVIRNHLKVESEPDVFYYNQPYYDFETLGPSYDFGTYGPPYGYGSFVPPLPQSDDQIKKDIEHEFFWSPFVHRDDITVKVDNGVAKLTGKVGTWVGYYEADQDAHKGGALEVVNWLKVRGN